MMPPILSVPPSNLETPALRVDSTGGDASGLAAFSNP